MSFSEFSYASPKSPVGSTPPQQAKRRARRSELKEFLNQKRKESSQQEELDPIILVSPSPSSGGSLVSSPFASSPREKEPTTPFASLNPRSKRLTPEPSEEEELTPETKPPAPRRKERKKETISDSEEEESEEDSSEDEMPFHSRRPRVAPSSRRKPRGHPLPFPQSPLLASLAPSSVSPCPELFHSPAWENYTTVTKPQAPLPQPEQTPLRSVVPSREIIDHQVIQGEGSGDEESVVWDGDHSLMEQIEAMNEQIRSLYHQQITLMGTLIATDPSDTPSLDSPAASSLHPRAISSQATALLQKQKQTIALLSQQASQLPSQARHEESEEEEEEEEPEEDGLQSYKQRIGLPTTEWENILALVDHREEDSEEIASAIVQVLEEGTLEQCSQLLHQRAHLLETLHSNALSDVFSFLSVLLQAELSPGTSPLLFSFPLHEDSSDGWGRCYVRMVW